MHLQGEPGTSWAKLMGAMGLLVYLIYLLFFFMEEGT